MSARSSSGDSAATSVFVTTPSPGGGASGSLSFAVGILDPNYASTVLLMHLDGAIGSTTFTDEKGHSATGTGGPV